MSLDVTVAPSKQFAATNDDITVAKLNLLGVPTVSVTGDLSQLDNVSTASPANGQPLVWDSANSYWEPGQVAVAYLGGGSPVTTFFLRGDGAWANPQTSSPADQVFQNTNFY
jgi:hypothetical protein